MDFLFFVYTYSGEAWESAQTWRSSSYRELFDDPNTERKTNGEQRAQSTKIPRLFSQNQETQNTERERERESQ
jgi:hypothetical protein